MAARASSSRAIRPAGSYPGSAAVAVPSAVQASTTVIWLRVSVPVLSVQTNVVEPSVSTASRWRTSTFRLAICSAPHASDSVTVGNNASGTRATVTPMANTNPSDAGRPMSAATAKKNNPTPTAMTATTRTTWCSSRVNGVAGGEVIVVIRLISARRMADPVADTSASASPSTANVPANSAPPSSTDVASLSPVNIEVSTRRPRAEVVSASAAIRSPGVRRSTSPTTTSRASISTGSASRRTTTSRGSSDRNRAAAWSSAPLLSEREQGVDDDDDNDGNGQRR